MQYAVCNGKDRKATLHTTYCIFALFEALYEPIVKNALFEFNSLFY